MPFKIKLKESIRVYGDDDRLAWSGVWIIQETNPIFRSGSPYLVLLPQSKDGTTIEIIVPAANVEYIREVGKTEA